MNYSRLILRKPKKVGRTFWAVPFWKAVQQEIGRGLRALAPRA